MVVASGSDFGQKGMLTATKALALAAQQLLRDSDLLEKAKAEFEDSTRDNPYSCPLPANAEPPLHQLGH